MAENSDSCFHREPQSLGRVPSRAPSPFGLADYLRSRAVTRLSVNFYSFAGKLLENNALNTESIVTIALLLKNTLGARSSNDEEILYKSFPKNHRNSDVRKGVSGGISRKLENHLRKKKKNGKLHVATLFTYPYDVFSRGDVIYIFIPYKPRSECYSGQNLYTFSDGTVVESWCF